MDDSTPIATPVRERLAAAPITWGVCEVPGWGHQLSPDEVLSDMASLGFSHTEMGPVGFLPSDGAELAAKLKHYDLQLLGGFVAVVLHDAQRLHSELERVDAVAAQMEAAGASWFVSCPVTDHDSWQRPGLSPGEWQHLFDAMGEVDRIVERHGLAQAFHPHVGTLIQDDAETRSVLANTDTAFVLDTAHLTLGGSDPLALVEQYADRIGVVHIKDVEAAVADRLAEGQISLMEAVQQGLFPPLGQGAVPVAEVVDALGKCRPDVWYTLEQDAALDAADADGMAKLRRGVVASLDYLQECGRAR